MSRSLAVVRIRGTINLKREIVDTLKMLKLFRKHHCIVLPASNNIVGMVKKVSNYVSWGEIDEETLKELILKRGKIGGNKLIDQDYIKKKVGDLDAFVRKVVDGKESLKKLGIKPFRLSPPSKGFGYRGIKHPFSTGGALGYRSKKINDLIRKMI